MSDTLQDMPPGYFEVRKACNGGTSYIAFRCPCGCGGFFNLPIHTAQQRISDNIGCSWEWNGHLRLPTLHPSIRNLQCKFHGFLTDGVWSACEDGTPKAPNCWRAES